MINLTGERFFVRIKVRFSLNSNIGDVFGEAAEIFGQSRHCFTTAG